MEMRGRSTRDALRLVDNGNTDVAAYGDQALVTRPQPRSAHERHGTGQMCVDRAQAPAPESAFTNKCHHLGVAEYGELTQVLEELHTEVSSSITGWTRAAAVLPRPGGPSLPVRSVAARS